MYLTLKFLLTLTLTVDKYLRTSDKSLYLNLLRLFDVCLEILSGSKKILWI